MMRVNDEGMEAGWAMVYVRKQDCDRMGQAVVMRYGEKVDGEKGVEMRVVINEAWKGAVLMSEMRKGDEVMREL